MRKLFSHGIIASALVLAWAYITLAAPPSAIKVAVTSAFLLLVPGHLIYRLIVKDGQLRKFWPGLAYAVALSTLYLMLIGLAASFISPFIGISRPLSLYPMTGLITASLIALIVSVLKKQGSITLPKVFWPYGTQGWLTVGFGALLPILSVAGAFILNNGGSGAVAVLTMGLVAAYALWMIWPRLLKLQGLFPYALFMMALAILLSNSMRGWFITGHDVMQEYQVFQLTSQHAIWSMKYFHDAYTACLSITILPTILSKLTGMSDPYVFKFMFQVIFSLVPAVLYITMSRFLPLRAAFLSAFVFISFPTFLLDMPMLCRQELAFLFFALALMTLFEAEIHRRSKSILVLLLGLGMILSHYSTSYVAIGVILIAKVLELGVQAWDRWRHNRVTARAVAVPLSWPIALALVLTVYLWNSQITNTSQSIANTIVGVSTGLPKIFGSLTESGVGSYSLVGHSLSDQQLFSQYANNTTAGRDLPASEYYPNFVTDKYPVQSATEQVSSPTVVGKVLAAVRVPLYSLYDSVRSGYAKLLQLLILIGLVALALRKEFYRVPRQYLLLGMASMIMIVLEVLMPTVINYGLLRLLQQSLIFMAPAIVLACYLLFRLLRFSPIWRVRATALLFAGFYMVNSGFLTTITGGYKPTLATSNSGLYYQAYYTHAQDLAGGQWLANEMPVGSVVNSDEFAFRRLVAYDDIVTRPTLAPAAIAQGAYVFISDGDTIANSVPFYYGSSLLYEQIPTPFLNNTKDSVYTNGGVTIYK